MFCVFSFPLNIQLPSQCSFLPLFFPFFFDLSNIPSTYHPSFHLFICPSIPPSQPWIPFLPNSLWTLGTQQWIEQMQFLPSMSLLSSPLDPLVSSNLIRFSSCRLGIRILGNDVPLGGFPGTVCWLQMELSTLPLQKEVPTFAWLGGWKERRNLSKEHQAHTELSRRGKMEEREMRHRCQRAFKIKIS